MGCSILYLPARFCTKETCGIKTVAPEVLVVKTDRGVFPEFCEEMHTNAQGV
jgi:hypothetical protein